MKKYILVLGGSTFMGKQLLTQLAPNCDYEIHYINRGKHYWNDEVSQIQGLHYTYGNRDDKKDFTAVLRYLTNKLKIIKWECVVDFSCYYAAQLRSVFDALRGICNLYIFISTDSIYDVCDKDQIQIPITENCDVRPKSKELYEKCKSSESYGHNKLKCEEFLRQINKEEFPHLVLRLPDVIGPYDDSGRFFALLKWIQRKLPVEIDDAVLNQKMSLVYSVDVANAICHVIENRLYENKNLINQSYNVCCDDSITYIELINLMASTLQVPIQQKPLDKAASFYPSVDCGILNNSKFKELGIKLTPLNDALLEAIRFFNEEGHKYAAENSHAEEKLKKKLE